MAQDFFAAFGKDSYGTIGNDTTINQADFDGINLIAIQALETRTRELDRSNQNLQADNQQLRTDNALLKQQVQAQEQSIAALQTAMNEQQQLLAKRMSQLEALVAIKPVIGKEAIAVK